MRNWCSNCLKVMGEKDEVDGFLEAAKGVDLAMPAGMTEMELDFDRLPPTPPDIPREARGEWRKEHWGTSWSCYIDPAYPDEGRWKRNAGRRF
jgi:hypothetical protein